MMETNPETNCGQWKPEWWRVPNAVTVVSASYCLSQCGSRGHMPPLTKVGDKTCPPQIFFGGDLEKAGILFWKPKKSRDKKVFSNTKTTFFYLLVRFVSSPNSPPFHGACLPHFHVPSESLQPTFQSTSTPLWIIIVFKLAYKMQQYTNIFSFIHV